jgi:hypothetical protein
LPFGEVKCDELRKALSYLPRTTGSKQQQRALGLAMARVVAHEIYHILARTTSHAASGLAKASHNLKDLVSGTLSFGEGESRAMVKGFTK